jgi:hypothetical protein
MSDMDDAAFVQEALRLTHAAEDRNLTLRTLGATAIRIHCPDFARMHEALGRKITDLDFVGPGAQANRLAEMFAELGYPVDRNARYRMALLGRYIFENPSFHADLFFDELKWNHTIDLRNRLLLDFPTITVSDLLLEKMQIVKINEKDIKDAIILLREHQIADNDRESVNGAYITTLLSADWGLFHTFTMNLSKVETYVQKYDQLVAEDRVDVTSKIEELRKMIEESPKGFRWKMRARTGTSSKWYREVDELT